MTKLNKPIPTLEPTIIQPKDSRGAPIPTVGSGPYKKVVGVTGTKFVGGTSLTSTGEVIVGAQAEVPAEVVALSNIIYISTN